MTRDRGRDSSQALRSALFAWGLIAALAGVVFLFIDYFVENEYGSLALTTLSSAALSIAGALLITEWIIKPLYVRDVLQVANLSAEIHRAGIRQARPANGVEWADVLAGGKDITVAIGNENVFRNGAWTAIMEASRTSPRRVCLHISEELSSAGFGASIEKQWRTNFCGSKGSELTVVPHGAVTQGLIVSSSSWIVATIADDPLNDDPLFVVFTTEPKETVAAALQRGIRRLNESTTPPIAGA